MTSHTNEIKERLLRWGMIFAVIAVAIAYLMRPICDPDFFWHLKTGEWIWHNRTLPGQDLFSFGLPPLDGRGTFILSSYWLAQLWYYFWYAIAGWSGIFIARILLATSAFCIVAAWRRVQTPTTLAIILLAMIQIGEIFQLDRPQVISFVIFAAILIALARYLEGSLPRHPHWVSVVTLSCLMALWPNLHGAFLVGLILLLNVGCSEGIKFFHPALNPVSRKRYLLLVAGITAALTASFLNPNPLESLRVGLALGRNSDSSLYLQLKEYQSSYRFLTELKGYTILLNWLMLLFSVKAVIQSRTRFDITWVSLLIGTALAGNLHVRYMPFFIIVSTLYLMRHFTENHTTVLFKSTVIITALSAALYFSADEFGNILQRYRFGSEPDMYYPKGAADYLKANRLQNERILNDYNWGGYLIWRLGDNSRVFCDGRQLDPVRFNECAEMFSVTDYERWRRVVERHGITTAILPVIHNGNSFFLSQSLYSDPEWMLVYNKNNAAVFRRKIFLPVR